jgi:large subunit ribosomal protein L13
MDYIIDAKNKRLGRIASEAATALQGKNQASYEKNKAGDIKVIIKNAKLVELSGKKEDKKYYFRHSGFLGGIKKIFFKDLVAKKGISEIIRKAVIGMLPDNKLRNVRIKKLIIEE